MGDTPTCRGPGHGAASASRSYLRDRAGAGRCCPAPLLPRCAAGGTAPPLLPGAVRTLLRFPAVSVLCGRRSLAFLHPRCRPAVRPCPLCRWRQALSVRARRPSLRRRCRCAPSAGPGLNRTGRLSRRRRARPLPAPRPREGQVRPRRHVGAVRAKQP